MRGLARKKESMEKSSLQLLGLLRLLSCWSNRLLLIDVLDFLRFLFFNLGRVLRISLKGKVVTRLLAFAFVIELSPYPELNWRVCQKVAHDDQQGKEEMDSSQCVDSWEIPGLNVRQRVLKIACSLPGGDHEDVNEPRPEQNRKVDVEHIGGDDS